MPVWIKEIRKRQEYVCRQVVEEQTIFVNVAVTTKEKREGKKLICEPVCETKTYEVCVPQTIYGQIRNNGCNNGCNTGCGHVTACKRVCLNILQVYDCVSFVASRPRAPNLVHHIRHGDAHLPCDPHGDP